MYKSKDQGRDEVGVLLLERSFWFIFKFFTYDKFTKTEDYPLIKSFEKIYTTTESIIIAMPN
jgi:hypothetical protein